MLIATPDDLRKVQRASVSLPRCTSGALDCVDHAGALLKGDYSGTPHLATDVDDNPTRRRRRLIDQHVLLARMVAVHGVRVCLG
jgi:hypothetical protein